MANWASYGSSHKFPAGTVVTLYGPPTETFQFHSGLQTAGTATMSNAGLLSFTGVTAGSYWAAAQVSGEWRAVKVQVV